MASGIQTNIGKEDYNKSFEMRGRKVRKRNVGGLKRRPATFAIGHKDKDKLRNNDLFTKARIGLESTMDTPAYAVRGLKGDPDFNFFESLKISKIPYYLGGLGLATICLAGRNNFNPAAKSANTELFKKILSGVLMYYVGREAANMAIDIPVKYTRGIDLNLPYKKVTSLREGNPLNLRNNKKQGTQKSPCNGYKMESFSRC